VDAVRRCAEQGDAPAQYFLGRMYDNGEGVPQDYAEAVPLFRLAADQGRAEGPVQPRGYVRQRRGRSRRRCGGRALVSVGCGPGRCHCPGWPRVHVRALGDGVPSDYVEAVRWYRQEERLNINISELSDAVNNRPNRFQ